MRTATRSNALLVLLATSWMSSVQADSSAVAQSTPKTWNDPKTGLVYVYIPAGSFLMGCASDQGSGCKQDEIPRHKVTLSRGFWISRTEVSVGQFQKFVEATNYVTDAEKAGSSHTFVRDRWVKMAGASWRKPVIKQAADHPVVCVSWNDAVAFSRWAGGRLPTEAEWEYASRGGRKEEIYAWGNTMIPNPDGKYYGNMADLSGEGEWRWTALPGYNDRFPATAPVGTFIPNDFGLSDMIGNVWEWCADSRRLYEDQDETDPTGPLFASQKAVRGTSWSSPPPACRISARAADRADFSSFNIGFRCVRDNIE